MRIHIVCPGDQVNGSVESLHQFGRAAATNGHDARIAYEPFDLLGPAATEFRTYGLRPDPDVPDDPDVLVVVAQDGVEHVAPLRAVQKLVWWLRVDDEVDVAAVTAAAPNARHLAQSEHARRFLQLHGITARMVGDYVHAGFVERVESLAPATRSDAVLYHADPTDEMTPQLVEASRGVLQWVPVQDATRAEVAEVMAYSKLYVDFGAHRGRTRMPREALLAGCCVITGRRGAAGNDVDLALPDGFVFDESDPGAASDVLNRIALTVMEPEAAQAAFDPLRASLGQEHDRFRYQVAGVTSPRSGQTRVLAGLSSLAASAEPAPES